MPAGDDEGMRVLVVEDHATLAGRIAQGLAQAGMAADAVHDGAAALDAAAQTDYDVIVLDRDLPVVRRGDLAVDLARHRASRGDRPLSLTRKEFGILETLVAADGAVVSAEELLEHVWDANADPFSNIVSVTMARLRRKLGDPPLIETVVGKGYRV